MTTAPAYRPGNAAWWRPTVAVVGSAILVVAGWGQDPGRSSAGGASDSSWTQTSADPLAPSANAGARSASSGERVTSPATTDPQPSFPRSGPNPTLPVGLTPTRIEIPAIGVDAEIVGLDLRGPAPEVPTDFTQTGWYEQTRRPGEIGPAVIAGHIDSVNGPAVFARLDELVAGNEIIVHGVEGETRTFVVKRSGQYPKEALPDEVFGLGQPVPELRLITCGGTFDRSQGHYRDNYVLYTELNASPAL